MEVHGGLAGPAERDTGIGCTSGMTGLKEGITTQGALVRAQSQVCFCLGSPLGDCFFENRLMRKERNGVKNGKEVVTLKSGRKLCRTAGDGNRSKRAVEIVRTEEKSQKHPRRKEAQIRNRRREEQPGESVLCRTTETEPEKLRRGTERADARRL